MRIKLHFFALVLFFYLCGQGRSQSLPNCQLQKIELTINGTCPGEYGFLIVLPKLDKWRLIYLTDTLKFDLTFSLANRPLSVVG